MIVCGVDLAGKEKNPTGLAFLGDLFEVKLVYTDQEIVQEIGEKRPDLVCIDSPLSWPKSGIMRESDRKLKRYGALPPLMGGMKSLTERGIRISRELRGLGFQVIEVFPRATQKILGIQGEEDLARFGISVSGLTKDEFDAILAALTGILHLEGKTEIIEGEIVVPSTPPASD